MGTGGEGCRDRARQMADDLNGRACRWVGHLPGPDDPLLIAVVQQVSIEGCG